MDRPLLRGDECEPRGPDDRLLIVGSEPQILLLAGRRSATPFIYFYPVLRAYPRHAEFQEAIWSAVQRRRPESIVSAEVPTSLLWDGRAERTLLVRLRALIEQEYEPRAVALVERPKGRLIELPETAVPFLKSTLEKVPRKVWIYRRRSTPPPADAAGAPPLGSAPTDRRRAAMARATCALPSAVMCPGTAPPAPAFLWMRNRRSTRVVPASISARSCCPSGPAHR